MRIFLIRHGESQGNVDSNIHQIIPDHDIALSALGMEQAQEAGHELKKYLQANPQKQAANQIASNLLQNILNPNLMSQFHNAQAQLSKVRLWNSPYRRARETAKIIGGVIDEHILDKREDVLLCEQQFGLFDGISKEEQAEKFPTESKCFEHQKESNGKFWARFPMGESPFDAACRLRQYFGTIKRDEDDKGISDHVIICHGTVLKLFTMMWLHKKYEWFGAEKGPGNCAIRIIENSQDGKYSEKYIFGGYRDGKLWKYNGNKYS